MTRHDDGAPYRARQLDRDKRRHVEISKERASLVPAAAVIPALLVKLSIVAVKTLVVVVLIGRGGVY